MARITCPASCITQSSIRACRQNRTQDTSYLDAFQKESHTTHAAAENAANCSTGALTKASITAATGLNHEQLVSIVDSFDTPHMSAQPSFTFSGGSAGAAKEAKVFVNSVHAHPGAG